ncbi:MAG: 4-(cytidine 5'-diphospho)-2-C-methyl-D-erythritol kinase [Roseivirga sp.]|nr:4-(cytidine 5'-diphospho)-2-C-methyl-D-erythritol kinase [Roseivirga sp.]
MLSFPNAKINLGLQITGKLPNGFHTISSCLYPIPWCDALEFVEAKKTSFQSTGILIPGAEKNNLVLKAYRLLKKDMPLPELSIHLHKAIPMGAGLGGGSADAAFILKALNSHYQLFLDDSLLEDYAAQLGSDCPFFIRNQPALATGTGTELTPLDLSLKGLHLVVINPGLHISTQMAYTGVSPKPSDINLTELLLSKDFDRWKKELINDFEASLFDKHAMLLDLKNELYDAGAIYASMSGSGSTMFGLFAEAIPLKPAWKAMQSQQFLLD